MLKKYKSLSFPILGGCDSTRPSRFRIQGGSPEPDGQMEGRTKEILVSNIGCQEAISKTLAPAYKRK